MTSSPAAEPFYFGPTDRSLFGWLHRPLGAQARYGVVICNPFGYESLCTHRTLRHLATRIAAAGIPALRFDYDGTGDSAGSDEDPDRLRAWVSSIGIAIDTLKERAGVERVCLVGLRFGAMLATLASVERTDVGALVALAPVVKSRAYLRELRALALSRPQPTPPEWATIREDLQEAAGFMLTAQTQESLADIDLTKIGDLRASRVLIIERDDLSVAGAWAESLRQRGTTVESGTFTGYAAMTSSAHESVVPEGLLDTATKWLSSLDEERVTPPRSNTASRDDMTDGTVRESIVRPDAQFPSFGILTEPATRGASRDVVLLLNAGAISRIGPGRLYVTLARRLASHGNIVLRFDICGIGDSPPRAGEAENSVYTPRAQEDIDAALLYLNRRYPDARHHAIGLCSGAYHGFKATASGTPPLYSMVAINPLTFFWKEGMSLAEPEFHVAAESARYQASALRLESWKKLLRGKVNVRAMLRIFALRLQSTATNVAREIARRLRLPLKDDLAAELRAAARARRKIHFIFGSGDPGLVLLKEQGGSSTVRRLTRRGALRTTVVPGADHTFTAHWSRLHLLELVTDHIRNSHT